MNKHALIELLAARFERSRKSYLHPGTEAKGHEIDVIELGSVTGEGRDAIVDALHFWNEIHGEHQ